MSDSYTTHPHTHTHTQHTYTARALAEPELQDGIGLGGEVGSGDEDDAQMRISKNDQDNPIQWECPSLPTMGRVPKRCVCVL